MIHATRRSVLAAAITLSLALPPAGANAQPQASGQATTRVHNLIGMVDYYSPPDFKVGTWVNYEANGGSSDGSSQHFGSTILIPGEERFWGDDGFWVESWLHPDASEATLAYATLMSYSVFQDSFPNARMLHYTRKQISGIEENGSLMEEISRRNVNSMRVRKWLSDREGWVYDTLGTDTVMTPAGTFECRKIQMKRGTGKTEDTADSTVYTEMRETRVVYMNKQVPITHMVREEISYTAQRRAWKIGQSQSGAPFQLLEESRLSTRLVAFGSTGKKSQLMPASRCKSLAEQFPPRATKSAPAKAPVKKTTPGGAAKR